MLPLFLRNVAAMNVRGRDGPRHCSKHMHSLARVASTDQLGSLHISHNSQSHDSFSTALCYIISWRHPKPEVD